MNKKFQNDYFKILQDLALAVSSSLDFEETLIKVCQSAVDTFNIEHCGLVLFDENYLEGKVVAEYPDQAHIKGITFLLQDVPLEEKLIKNKKPIYVYDVSTEDSLGTMKNILHDQFNIYSMLFIPIINKGKTIGSFGLDSIGHHRKFTPEEIELCLLFSAHVSIAVENARLFRESKLAQESLRSSFNASTKLVSSDDPKIVLKDIVEFSCEAMNAAWVSVIMINELGVPYSLTKYGNGSEDEQIKKMVRPHGISIEVMNTGSPVFIENAQDQNKRLSPMMKRKNVGAAACIPLTIRKCQIGVLWIHYENPREFSKTEEDALQLFANQAAIAYDNARRIEELDFMHKSVEAIAEAADLAKVLEMIAQGAQVVLHADAAAVWPFSNTQNRFLPDLSVATGVLAEGWIDFAKQEPRTGGAAAQIIEEGWIGVEDINDTHRYKFIGDKTRKFLNKKNLCSYLGIVLQAGEETLGVLFVNYTRPHKFPEEEQKTAKRFANHAALALKKAGMANEIKRALDQVRKAHKTAHVVAQVSTLGNIYDTLDSVVMGTKNTLGCDAIVLFVYNQQTRKLDHPPLMLGVNYPEKAQRFSEVEENSLVYRMLEQDKLYPVEDVSKDQYFQDRRFALDEEIKSCVAVPLIVSKKTVGVMFINYREFHQFKSDELDNISFFTNQAAVAIYNAQLYEEIRNRAAALQTLNEESQKRARALNALSKAGKTITSSFSIIEISNSILRQTRELTGIIGNPSTRSYLALVKGNKLELKCVDPTRDFPNLNEKIGNIDLNDDECIGVIGRAIKEKKTQPVPDIKNDPDFINFSNDKIGSAIAVPIVMNKEVIGVLRIDFSEINGFDEDDLRDLESLASQAAVAIQNANRFSELCHSITYQQAVYRVSKAISASFQSSKGELLLEILKQIVKNITLIDSSPRALSGSFLSYNQETNELTRDCIYDPNIQENLDVVQVQVLDRTKGKIGISGRAVLERQVQLTNNVLDDPDYIKINKKTKSEIDIPLLTEDSCIGVLSLGCDEYNAFDGRDKKALLSIAKLAVIAINNADIYHELLTTQSRAGASIILAWMGIAESSWRHSIDAKAQTIIEENLLLKGDLRELGMKEDEIAKRLSKINKLAEQIKLKPITAPLSNEQGTDIVPINALIGSRTTQLINNPNMNNIDIKLNLDLSDSTMVRINREWFRRAFDILIDNAVDAIEDNKEKKICIGTRSVKGSCEIYIADNGPGIPEVIKESIQKGFVSNLNKPNGIGVGLLIARIIVQTYNGILKIEYSNQEKGTSMVIRLPQNK